MREISIPTSGEYEKRKNKTRSKFNPQVVPFNIKLILYWTIMILYMDTSLVKRKTRVGEHIIYNWTSALKLCRIGLCYHCVPAAGRADPTSHLSIQSRRISALSQMCFFKILFMNISVFAFWCEDFFLYFCYSKWMFWPRLF